MTSGCISCSQGFHFECAIEECNDDLVPGTANTVVCCCNGLLDPWSATSPFGSGRGDSGSDADERDRTRGRRQLADEDVRDPRSTMRKRARAALKAANRLHPNMRCEWRGMANAGLEKHPIVGCRDGKATHVHHINKNTFDNELDNLVHICNTCHNRTHGLINPCTSVNNPNARVDYPIANVRKATPEEMRLWNDGEYPRADHSRCETHSDGNSGDDELDEDGQAGSTRQ